MDTASLSHGIDLDGISPDEAFAILGNETRLDILRVLWSASVPGAGTDPTILSYSDLLRGVELADSGKFNYHLSKLVPHFVAQTDGGYRLTRAGKRIARTVVAVSDGEAAGFPCDLDVDCPFCGGRVTATYHDQQLVVRCNECGGKHGHDAPDGTLSIMGFPAAGLTDRTPEEVLERGLYKCMLDVAYMMHGVCRECAGRIATSVSVCDDHETADDPICRTCETPYEVWAEQRCERCGLAKRLPVELFVMGLAPVIGFFYDHGVDVLEPSYEEINACVNTLYTVSVADDPFRIHVTIEAEGEELILRLDDTLTVVDVARRRSEVTSSA